MLNLPTQYYAWIFYNILFMLAVVTSFRYIQVNDASLVMRQSHNYLGTIILAMLIVIYFSSVPIVRNGDIDMYKFLYDENIQETGFSKEWLWNKIVNWCNFLGLSFREYLIVIAFCYVGLMFFCCVSLFPDNVWVSFLFFITSFSFFGYGMNGIRNGMSLSVLLIGLVILLKTETTFNRKMLGALCLFLSTRIHVSASVPAICTIVALFLVKEPKVAIRFWLFSIVLSLVAGSSISDMFSGFGFDERVTKYTQAIDAETMREFSHTGFRWDFLLYSAMPIWLTWYVTVKRNIKDRTFNIIAVTYILANSFWIMVIRSSFSNRFAYLSWFLYPLVIAYPLLKFHIWKNQDKKITKILLAYSGFTYFMFLIGK